MISGKLSNNIFIDHAFFLMNFMAPAVAVHSRILINAFRFIDELLYSCLSALALSRLTNKESIAKHTATRVAAVYSTD
jgi:hypothetical protein